VSEFKIFGPIGYVSDIDNSVSFEMAMYEDYRFNYKKILVLFRYQQSEVHAWNTINGFFSQI